MSTHYQILKVPMAGTPDEIRTAYRRAAMRWHPDRHADHVDEATLRIKKINEAYRVLSNPYLRSRYDIALRIRQERRAARDQVRDQSLEKTRVGADASPFVRLRAIGYRLLYGIDVRVDAVLRLLRRGVERLPHGRRISRSIRYFTYKTSPSGLMIAGLGACCAILAILVANRALQPKGAPVRSANASTMAAPASTSDPDAIIDRVLPGYDRATRTAALDLHTVTRTSVYEAYRRLESVPLQARFDGHEDLGSDYRMYYFTVSAVDPASVDCPECDALYARFVSRRVVADEVVVVPLELVVEPERVKGATVGK